MEILFRDINTIILQWLLNEGLFMILKKENGFSNAQQ